MSASLIGITMHICYQHLDGCWGPLEFKAAILILQRQAGKGSRYCSGIIELLGWLLVGNSFPWSSATILMSLVEDIDIERSFDDASKSRLEESSSGSKRRSPSSVLEYP